ncbi:hypothetical protein Cfor_11050 [Coptotermes formosanus]|uniref:Mpv17-like protein 2 n=1 Tax=Coptotermes formosanus TaxID=36987 RepID=A0A6L2PMP2_COPFO|nr:hypothetical protein Cfor_11050 [Coptotermes formosanus]
MSIVAVRSVVSRCITKFLPKESVLHIKLIPKTYRRKLKQITVYLITAARSEITSRQETSRKEYKCRFFHNLSIKRCCNLHTNVNGTLNKTFGKYLLLTNTVSSGLLMAAGDLIQQEIDKRRTSASKRFDWKRTGRMFVIGLAQGPPQHIFYKFLDRSFPGRDLKSISRKILLDQLIASPVCICIFFFGMGLTG